MPIVVTYPARAVSTACRTASMNAILPRITWSAANEPTTMSPPLRRASTAVASAIAAVESRGAGSAKIWSAPISGSCSRTVATWQSPVLTHTWSMPQICARRS